MEYVIQTAGLTKIFRDFWGHQRVIAVDRLDLEIVPHEVFGMLGPNGSGKSTTIKMLLGLLFPARGWARVLGQLPGDVKTNARIGYLPEESYLYPFLNARETLDFYGRLFGLTYQQRKARIDSLLDMVGLTSVARRPIGEYSKGMIRRIGLAQAIINDPDLLILDEPTSGLDPIGTRQIKDLVRELGQRGKTVLMCSHLLADVEDVCDRICILYGGKIQAQGRVDELLAHRELTQIRSGKLSEATIKKIKQIVTAENPDIPFETTTPRDRLEDYFLHIVEKAQNSQLETSGARMGTGLSDFLASASDVDTSSGVQDESSALIKSLVQPDRDKHKSLLEDTMDISHTTPVTPADNTVAAGLSVTAPAVPVPPVAPDRDKQKQVLDTLLEYEAAVKPGFTIPVDTRTDTDTNTNTDTDVSGVDTARNVNKDLLEQLLKDRDTKQKNTGNSSLENQDN